MINSCRNVMSTSTLSTLVDLDPIPSSSSSNDSLAVMNSLPINSKLCLLPGTTAPALSVKEKIQSFECGKPPVLEEFALTQKLSPSTSQDASVPDPPALLSPSQLGASGNSRKIISEEALQMLLKRQPQKNVLRQRPVVSHDEG